MNTALDHMYRYYVHTCHSPTGDHMHYSGRDIWLDCVLMGQNRPRPPAWWIRSQEQEGRDRKTASIIWGHNYGPERKYVIWSQAPDDDFIGLGYLEVS